MQYFKNQHFDPAGLTSRYKPPEQASRARVFPGGQVAFLHSASVNMGEQLPPKPVLPPLVPPDVPRFGLAVNVAY